MRGKTSEGRKGQVIMFFICLFVITGSLCGCIIYGILKPDILKNFAAETIYGEKTLYFFVSSSVFPYAILLSSVFNFGIAICVIMLFIQSFAAGCVVFQSFTEGKFFPCCLYQSVLLTGCIIAAAFSINRIINHFYGGETRKPYLKREKIKNTAENIIIFSAVTVIIILSCFLRKKF